MTTPSIDLRLEFCKDFIISIKSDEVMEVDGNFNKYITEGLGVDVIYKGKRLRHVFCLSSRRLDDETGNS